MKQEKLSLLVVLAAAAISTASCATREPTASTPATAINTATVLEVIDGDTIRARIGNAHEVVRLVGIDTPETKHPTKGVQCFGPQASDFLTRLLPVGSGIRVERDDEARDVYNRLLLYIFQSRNNEEVFINREMVLRGFARPLTIAPNSRYHSTFVDAAFDAQRNNRGLWKACK